MRQPSQRSRKQSQRAWGCLHSSPYSIVAWRFLRSIFLNSLCFSVLTGNVRELDKSTQAVLALHDLTLPRPLEHSTGTSFSYLLLFNLWMHALALQQTVNFPRAKALPYTCFWNHIKYIFLKFHSTTSPVDDQKYFPNEWMSPCKSWFMFQPIKCYLF